MIPPVESSNYVMDSFEFESGRVLENVNVEYGTSGIPKYDDNGNIVNAIVFCPTLKGGHSVLDKYHEFIKKFNFNKNDYFFIRITSLGTPDSCSPSSTGLRYNFPSYSFRDRVNFKRQFLAEKFNIKEIFGIIGEGTGGFEVYTWACEYPEEMEFIVILNSSFKAYGYHYVLVKCAEAIIDSSDDFYTDEYSVSLSKLVVAITRLLFAGYFSRGILEELSNDEIDVLMEDYVDEGLFMDIHDFKSRNDCILEYDVLDKLSDIKAKALILGLEDYLFINAEKDILNLKDVIKNSTVAVFKDKESFYDENNYTEILSEIVSFLDDLKK